MLKTKPKVNTNPFKKNSVLFLFFLWIEVKENVQETGKKNFWLTFKRHWYLWILAGELKDKASEKVDEAKDKASELADAAKEKGQGK